MVEAYISTMGGHFYFSFPGDILCQFHHQLCPQFRSGSKGDPLIHGTQVPNLSNHRTAVLDRQRFQGIPEFFETFPWGLSSA